MQRREAVCRGARLVPDALTRRAGLILRIPSYFARARETENRARRNDGIFPVYSDPGIAGTNTYLHLLIWSVTFSCFHTLLSV